MWKTFHYFYFNTHKYELQMLDNDPNLCRTLITKQNRIIDFYPYWVKLEEVRNNPKYQQTYFK